MPQIIVLSDIHGNLAALQAAWRDMQTRPTDRIYCLGDIAAFGPHPEACVAFLREEIRPTAVIRGNTDRYLSAPDEAPEGPGDEDTLRASLAWTRDALSPASLDWLANLPAEATEEVESSTLHLVHGAPGDDELGIGAGTPPVEMERLFGEAGPGITFCGHTHAPFRSRVGQHLVVNVGSIGMPFDGDQRAAYVRARLVDGTLRSFEFRRVAYRLSTTLGALKSGGMPLADTISRRLRFAER